MAARPQRFAMTGLAGATRAFVHVTGLVINPSLRVSSNTVAVVSTEMVAIPNEPAGLRSLSFAACPAPQEWLCAINRTLRPTGDAVCEICSGGTNE